ncbi:hypothetical protein FRC00_008630 [Tulasnella sp. 408]|nr:hypothetical protein FRC00_008630 [Tulasnella sp. 408]
MWRQGAPTSVPMDAPTAQTFFFVAAFLSLSAGAPLHCRRGCHAKWNHTPAQDTATLRSEDGATDEKKKMSQDKDVEKADSIVDEKVAAAAVADPNEDKLVHGWKLITIFIGMLLSRVSSPTTRSKERAADIMAIFLVALDQTIVATAIPRIASGFNALEQVTWIASAYFLTQAGLMLTYGQILRVAPTKWVYLAAVALFEIGSAICGAAPNINVLIFGRAFAGVGAAGIFVSCLSIIAVITKLEQRPLLFGLFGGVFALSSVIGPLMGGAFTDHVSWRWCFYINLPFGAITVFSILAFIKSEHSIAPRASASGAPTWRRLITNTDWVSSIRCLGMVTTLLLPLQWGAVTKAWTDKSVIACFVVFAVVLFIWLGWEWYMGDNAVMPLSLFKRRTQVGACLEAFFIMLVLLCAAYYLPLYYQSAEQHSATRSGIDILIYMIMVVVGAAIGGGIINYTGRSLPFLIGSPLLASVGDGIVFWALTKNPKPAILYGTQVLLGLGVGGAMQNTVIAIQAEYVNEPEMVPQSTSLLNFTQLVGGIIGIAISGTIFGNQLSKGIAHYAPNLDPALAATVKQSVEVIHSLTGDDKAHVIRAYSEALGYVFILAIPCGVLASVSGTLIKNYNLKELKLQPGMAAA